VQIVQLSHYMPPHIGGIELVAQLLARGLVERGHAVTWFGSAPGHPAPPQNQRDNVRRVQVPAFNWPERRFGLPYPVWSPTFLPAFRRTLADADCVVAHDCLYPGTLAAAALRGARRLVVVQHVGEVDFGPWLTRLERLAYRTVGRRVLGRAAHVVCCSTPVQTWLQQELDLQVPCSLVPNAIEDESFTLVTPARRRELRAKWQLSGRVLLFVGRLVAKKRLERVLASLAQLPSDVSLLVVGQGPLEHLLAGHPKVRYLGLRSRTEVAELTSASDAFVLVSEGEGLPLSLQEALLSGLPAVVSDQPAFVANLKGAPGVRFIGTSEPLASALESALADVAREPIAAWARERYGRAQFLDAYEHILGAVGEGS
jgi:glycosyltransferase involved in cell wall biosynthesis